VYKSNQYGIYIKLFTYLNMYPGNAHMHTLWLVPKCMPHCY